MTGIDLSNQWETAAEFIETDPMRPYRYGMGLRYFKHLDKNVKILDVGCGEGTGLFYLARYGFKNLYGVEVSNKRIDKVKQKFNKGIAIDHIAVEESLPFPDNTFDVVISMAVVEHSLNPDFFISEIARVAKKQSIIVVSSDCFAWRILQRIKLYKSVQPIDKTLTFTGFKKLFTRAELNINHFDVFNFPPRGEVLFYYILKLNKDLSLKKTDIRLF